MPLWLGNIRDNFWTDPTNVEAWDFTETSGPFKGLLNPARTLDLVSGGAAHERVAGLHGGAVKFNNGDFFRAAADAGWNALENAEGWLFYSYWVKHDPTIATTFAMGVTHASDTAKNQWASDVSTANGVQLFDGSSSVNSPFIDSNDPATVGAWEHQVGGLYYDGSGTGTNLKLWVNGVEHTTIGGSLAVTPGFLGDYFRLGAGLNPAASNLSVCSLILWKSSTNPLSAQAVADLYNNGAGIPFVGGAGAGANRGRGRGRARASAL